MFGQPHNDPTLQSPTLQPAAKDDASFGQTATDTMQTTDYVDAITNAVPEQTQAAPATIEPVTPEPVTPEVFTGQPMEAPAVTEPVAPVAAEPAPEAPTTEMAVSADNLLDIKQQALQQLSPLVGQLNQDPEEKFRTTMMMIQAADNSALIKDAYETALQIGDEKVRAQALLDIVNEINYFTHAKDEE